MATTLRKHSHRRSSSLHIEDAVQPCEERVILVSQIDSAQTMKLLQQSQKKSSFQTIIEEINVETQLKRNIRKLSKVITHGHQHPLPSLTQEECLQVSQTFAHQMLEISQITTKGPVIQKQTDYVPFRNRLRYQKKIDLKVNKAHSHSHNSYKDLLSFNLSEFGCQMEVVQA